MDFEHERREIVIQWVLEAYGRDRAALCSTVIRYRTKGALRDVGKVLGLSEDVITLLNALLWGCSEEGIEPEQAKELNLEDRRLKLAIELARELIGTPRHLPQHPGGFVLTRDRLNELVPIEPAAMENRQVIEWDKDDIDDLKFMMVDCLALGTFQIESRAQMAMLPGMKPRTFYDLVIEVAIVRPGRVQREGDVVHLIAHRLTDLSAELASVGERDVAFPAPQGRGDQAKAGGDQDPSETLGHRSTEVQVADHQTDRIRIKTRDFR